MRFVREPDPGVRSAVDVLEIKKFHRVAAQSEGHFVPVFDVRQNNAGPWNIRRRTAPCHQCSGAGGGDDAGRWREHEISGRMVAVRLGIDDIAHRLWGELLNKVHHHEGLVRVLAGIDQDHAILSDDDADVGIVVLRVDIDPIRELLHIRPKVLREGRCGHAQAHNYCHPN